MKITILCSSPTHPVNQWLDAWMEKHADQHDIRLLRAVHELRGGDLLFLISCTEIVPRQAREMFRKVLLIHASDLPRGRGWSPHIWEIVNGATEITLSLIEAEDQVDTGDIWRQTRLEIPVTDLYDEINAKLFDAEIGLMDYAVSSFDRVVPRQQDPSVEPSYYPRRTPDDSELDTAKTLQENFNLLRLADPERYPAFFYHAGQKYHLYIEKTDD